MHRTLVALFHASAARPPDELEHDRLHEIATLLAQDGSGALMRGLAALVAGVDADGELDEEARSWAWLLRDLAAHVPGVEHVDGADHELLRVDRSGRFLRLDRAGWSTGLRAERARTMWLVDAGPAGHSLELDADARGLLRACEIHCVAACCGIVAFEIAPACMRPWVDEVGRERAELLARALRDAVIATERLVGVRSMDLNAQFTSRGECSRHLASWADALEEAITPDRAEDR